MAVRIQLTARRRRATGPAGPDVAPADGDESHLLERAEAVLDEIDATLGHQSRPAP